MRTTLSMKTAKMAILLIIALVGSSIVTASADARGRGHGHGHRHFHGHHHHRSHIGLFFSVPGPFFYYPSYYYPRYYYPPVVAAAPAPVYIEQPPTVAAQGPATETAGAFWYYCRDSQTYYPYVQQCASPWERVTPNSAPPP